MGQPFHETSASPSAGKACDRADAFAVVRRLREAGHVAYFAGGCVRDLLLEREPKDYDVATDAPPERVRSLFSSTQAVGAAFGVILVRQRRSLIEVATFRSDGAYLDGRRPSAVRYTTAEEDARRRDFTINGLFLDPLREGPIENQVIDYVGGREDIAAGRLRAIGDPELRFSEDYLRLLRTVRFAARFGFAIDPATGDAIRRHGPRLARISPERIGEEMRMMLVPATRALAWRLLGDLGLNVVLFRFLEAPPGDVDWGRDINTHFARLTPGRDAPFGLALAAAVLQQAWWSLPTGIGFRTLLDRASATHFVQALRRALKISNEISDDVQGAIEGLGLLLKPDPPELPGVAALKRFLARPTAAMSVELLVAFESPLAAGQVAAIQTRLAELAREDVAPPPLVTGDDLTAAGLKPGPVFRTILDTVYDAQLEGKTTTRDDAMAIALRLADSLQKT